MHKRGPGKSQSKPIGPTLDGLSAHDPVVVPVGVPVGVPGAGVEDLVGDVLGGDPQHCPRPTSSRSVYHVVTSEESCTLGSCARKEIIRQSISPPPYIPLTLL